MSRWMWNADVLSEIKHETKSEDPTLFISGYSTAIRINPDHKIDVIINVCNEEFPDYIKEYWEDCCISNHYLPIIDHEDEDIIGIAEQVYQILEKCLYQNVLVNCYIGMSRSVSCVIYWLMRRYDMNYDAAYELIKKNREIADPNEGFEKKLRAYDKSRQQVNGQ